MYTVKDFDFLMKIQETKPDIYEYIEHLNNEFHQDLSLGCHEVSNIISLIFGNFQLIELTNPQIRQNLRWQQMNEDIRYLIHFMESISVFRYAQSISPVSTKADAYIYDLADTLFKSSVYSSLHILLYTNPAIPEISMDRSKIAYIIKSVLDNIADNNTPGDVDISLVAEGTDILITISDNISYLSPEIQEKLFRPFTTSKQYHPGLSLATSSRIMLAHNGCMEYHANAQGGSSFVLRFRKVR
ncbi:MAG: sensor histidine kinase [Butyrivibrio sp.]